MKDQKMMSFKTIKVQAGNLYQAFREMSYTNRREAANKTIAALFLLGARGFDLSIWFGEDMSEVDKMAKEIRSHTDIRIADLGAGRFYPEVHLSEREIKAIKENTDIRDIAADLEANVFTHKRMVRDMIARVRWTCA